MLTVVVSIAAGVVYFASSNSGSVVGTYINTNYQYPQHIAEIPKGPDTLHLYEDGTFQSGYWGTGTYKLDDELFKTEVELLYEYSFGIAGITLPVTTGSDGRVRLMLNDAHDHCYLKVE